MPPSVQQRLNALTARATAIVEGLNRHKIGASIKVDIVENDHTRATVVLDGEAWLSMCEMLLAFLDTKQRKLEEMKNEQLPVVPGPEGFQ